MKLRLDIIPLIAVALWTPACRSSETTTERFAAPGGKYAATLTIKDCGAGCSPSAVVTLHDLYDRTGKGRDMQVFDGVGGWPIELHWSGPRNLIITFCQGSRYSVRSEIGEANMEGQNGDWGKSVTVSVITKDDVTAGGKAYCRFPETDPESAGKAS